MKKKTLISIIACVIALVLVIIGTCVTMKHQSEQPKDVTMATRRAYVAEGVGIKNSEQVTMQISTAETTVPTTEVSTTQITTTTEMETTTEESIESTTETTKIEVTETETEMETTVENETVTESEVVETENESNTVTFGNKAVELRYSDRYTKYTDGTTICSSPLTAPMGVKHFNGHRETWYSQKVLPGGGLKIPGRHVADDGTVRDGEGYIVVASDLSYLSRGSVVLTSLGPGKVYDTGCAYGTIDIYVNW